MELVSDKKLYDIHLSNIDIPYNYYVWSEDLVGKTIKPYKGKKENLNIPNLENVGLVIINTKKDNPVTVLGTAIDDENDTLFIDLDSFNFHWNNIKKEKKR